MMWKYIIKPILFCLDPEFAHYLTLGLLKKVCKIPGIKFLLKKIFQINYSKPVELFGLRFKNPVGLAAGLDKNGAYINELALFGFSHIEIGTITPRPQEGNSKPRLFRLKEDEAIINRMGFNNNGADEVSKRLSKLNKPSDLILGINIGKNKDTPLEKAYEDYLICLEKLYPYADYFTINISSPNTPGLRALQGKDYIEKLLDKVLTVNSTHTQPKPILLKIAPDLDKDQLSEIKSICISRNVSGIIIGNTTITRENLKINTETVRAMGDGGLSGQPLRIRSSEKLNHLKEAVGNIPLISTGGINDGRIAQERLNIGADLLQIYTAFIYEGPGVVKKILNKLK